MNCKQVETNVILLSQFRIRLLVDSVLVIAASSLFVQSGKVVLCCCPSVYPKSRRGLQGSAATLVYQIKVKVFLHVSRI